MSVIVSREARSASEQHFLRTLKKSGDLIASGRPDRAQAELEALLRLNPERHEIHNLLGVAAVARERTSEALPHFEKAVALAPNSVAYLNNLGRAYVKLGRLELAVPAILRLLKLSPDHEAALYTIAELFQKMGKAARSLPYLEAYLARHPDHAGLIAARASILESIGESEEAANVYERLKHDPKYRVHALFRLSQLRRHRAGTALLGEFEEALAAATADKDRKLLHSGLGKILEDLGEYDAAFPHYGQANALEATRFDTDSHNRRLEWLKVIFTPQFFAARQDYGSASDLPVFVVGMPRSGTTLTEQIIASHPQADGAGELRRLRSMARTLGYNETGELFPDAMRAMTAEQSRILADNYLALLRFYSRSAERIVDKMPFNYEMLGLASLIFPKARIVHCRRDALDTCFSIYVNRFTDFHSYANSLDVLGRYYRSYAALMDHWREVLPRPMHEMEYEATTAEPEPRIRALIGFLGLPWDDACLAHNKAKTTVTTLSSWQVRQPLYRTSVKRWKRFEKHLAPLIDALGDLAQTD
jgi:tetratricopeptide (TPR) repeat protein